MREKEREKKFFVYEKTMHKMRERIVNLLQKDRNKKGQK